MKKTDLIEERKYYMDSIENVFKEEVTKEDVKSMFNHLFDNLEKLSEKTITFNLISENDYPKPQHISKHTNTYYLIETKYGYCTAMFLIDDNGNCGFYSDYYNKIVTPIIKWTLQ